MWGTVLKRDLLGETREEDKFHTKEQLQEYLKSEIEKQGENVSILNLDVSLIDDLSSLFVNIADGIKTLDLSGWKTGNVKDMCGMFYYCKNLKSIDISGWDTSNVKNMSWMFWNCGNLKSLDLSGWDTSKVGNMENMFAYCKGLEALNVSGWNTSKVEDMSWMFWNCKNLKSLDLSGWDTSKVKDMSEMFYECPAPYEAVDNKIVKKYRYVGNSIKKRSIRRSQGRG